jgi:hypothetical protein
MADAVTSRVLNNGPRSYVAHLTNISDGTGESAVVKVDISTLKLANGLAPTKTAIAEVQWSIQGFSSVQILWDHTTDDTALVLGQGNGYMEFASLGNIPDPASAGGTGDILLTTNTSVAGASYDITLVLVIS